MSIPSDADTDKLAEAALAILWLGAHGDGDATRVWKQIDWELTGLLYDRGWISDPQTKAQSVLLSEEGEKLAEKFFQELFSKPK